MTLLDGKPIENLHVAEAERTIALGRRIAELAAAAAGWIRSPSRIIVVEWDVMT